ncbi:hypothetical protein AAHH78_43130, partial [Burkholderia pseudomallei]
TPPGTPNPTERPADAADVSQLGTTVTSGGGPQTGGPTHPLAPLTGALSGRATNPHAPITGLAGTLSGTHGATAGLN